ncbi:hypothetical protein CCACVL1_22007 [Corchorus capsularis]|uniref:Uncharacterized protein n=1 Tax=Corchorus capsularis TaxID=210143 RepID=A0A1R3H1J3_COCAP|nr:hypothetical protein CCACVL1_22007 [Corchorus capsularis]
MVHLEDANEIKKALSRVRRVNVNLVDREIVMVDITSLQRKIPISVSRRRGTT